MNDAKPRVGQGNGMGEHPAPVGRVDGHVHRAKVVDAKPGQQALRSIGQPDQHMVTLPDAKGVQRPCPRPHTLVRLLVAPLGAVLEHGEHLLRAAFCPLVQHVAQNAIVACRDARIHRHALVLIQVNAMTLTGYDILVNMLTCKSPRVPPTHAFAVCSRSSSGNAALRPERVSNMMTARTLWAPRTWNPESNRSWRKN